MFGILHLPERAVRRHGEAERGSPESNCSHSVRRSADMSMHLPDFQIEDDRANIINTANEARDAFQARQRDILVAERELGERKQGLDLLEVEQGQVVSDRQEAIKAKTQVECLVRDLSDASASSATRRSVLQRELSGLESSIREKEEELQQEVQPNVASVSDQLKQLQAQLDDASTRSEALYAKQGRSNQFRSQQERDQYLSQEIQNLEARVAAKEQRLRETRALFEQGKAKFEQLERSLKELSANLDGRKGALQDLSAEASSFSSRKNLLSEQRKSVIFHSFAQTYACFSCWSTSTGNYGKKSRD